MKPCLKAVPQNLQILLLRNEAIWDEGRRLSNFGPHGDTGCILCANMAAEKNKYLVVEPTLHSFIATQDTML